MQKINPEITFIFFIKNCLKMLFIFPLWFLFVFMAQFYLHIQPYFFDIVGFLLLISFILFGYFWAWLSYTTFGYSLTPEGLKIEQGVIIRKVKTIPYHHIKTIDYFINPIVTHFLGIYNIHIAIQEASNTEGIVVKEAKEIIPGLDHESAERIKRDLIGLSHQQIQHRTYFNASSGFYK